MNIIFAYNNSNSIIIPPPPNLPLQRGGISGLPGQPHIIVYFTLLITNNFKQDGENQNDGTADSLIR